MVAHSPLGSIWEFYAGRQPRAYQAHSGIGFAPYSGTVFCSPLAACLSGTSWRGFLFAPLTNRLFAMLPHRRYFYLMFIITNYEIIINTYQYLSISLPAIWQLYKGPVVNNIIPHTHTYILPVLGYHLWYREINLADSPLIYVRGYGYGSNDRLVGLNIVLVQLHGLVLVLLQFGQINLFVRVVLVRYDSKYLICEKYYTLSPCCIW